VQPHPDLAAVYLDLRPGDSTSDRLARARSLLRLMPQDPESQLTLARAAIDAHDFKLARATLEPLLSGIAEARPSARICLLMADLEEAETGNPGRVREWLARASRAPRDKAWVADGVVSDTWGPVSPVTGKLDAYRWQTPPERLSAPYEPPSDAVLAPQIVEAAPPPAPVPPPLLAEPAPQPVPEPPAPVAPVVSPPAPKAAEPAPEEDATARLAAIRANARSVSPVTQARRADVFPLMTAPDDPGPDVRS
jgi:HemY protein